MTMCHAEVNGIKIAFAWPLASRWSIGLSPPVS
jgi:hypothetical protein